jgi:hypothetical protein
MTQPIADAPCPCNLCTRLGELIEAHRLALHAVEVTRYELGETARQVDRRHHLPSAWDAPMADTLPRNPSKPW